MLQNDKPEIVDKDNINSKHNILTIWRTRNIAAFILFIIISITTFILAISYNSFSSGDFGFVKQRAYTFLEMLSQKKYETAYNQFVDNSRVKYDELEKAGNLVAQYSKSPRYFGYEGEGLYIVGYKILVNNENCTEITDTKFEFHFCKVKDKWQVVRIIIQKR